MKKIVIKVAVIFINFVVILAFASNMAEAKNNIENNTRNIVVTNEQSLNFMASDEEIKDTIINLMSTINSEGINKRLLTEATNLYEQISEKYSNEKIAEIINENKNTLKENGIKEENIQTAVNVLNNISTEQAKKILKSVDVEKIGNKLEEGATAQEILTEVTSNLTTKDKVNLIFNMVGSIKIIKNIFIICVIIFVYRTLLRCIIYKKAGRKPWASIVPIYRNVVMLKVCQMSAWWLLLLLIPIVGWIILWIVSVASKFMLAEKFGKGVGFSFGLWLLPVIFESIIAFSKNIHYLAEKEE